jgi:hypothetical protein
MDSDYRYDCLCHVGSTDPADHLPLCRKFNDRRVQELQDSWNETGIARYWREQEAMTGIERVNADRDEDADRLLDQMATERKLGYRTIFTVIETGKTYEVKDMETRSVDHADRK